MTTILTRPPQIDPAVWRPELPLIVMERCETAQLTMVWVAIRWLMALMPRRNGFSVREIADRARVNYRKVGRWCQRLEELGLIERIGETTVPGLDTPRPIYSIDLRALDALSHGDVLDEVLIRYQTNAPPPPRVPDAQLSYLDCERDLPEANSMVRERERDLPEANSMVRERERDLPEANSMVREREREQANANVTCANANVTCANANDDVREREHEKKKTEEDRRRPRSLARAATLSDNPNNPNNPNNALYLPASAPPATPPGAAPVFAHPFQIWIEAVTVPRAIDMRHLEFLEAEHDQHTGGHGQYWVARAILAATATAGDTERDIGAIYHILNRWRDENAYGSDAPKYTRKMEQRNDNKRKRERRNGNDGRNDGRNGHGDVDPHRLTWDDLPDYLKEP